jgi:phospholipase/lecithinase/hemolysin
MKLKAACLALLSCVALNSFAADKPVVDHMVFFGDSLTDNGNLYHHDFHLLPKSPPYFEGRFSDGYTWADDLTLYFYQKDYISGENYAVGGATTILHNPFAGFLPYDMAEEMDAYLWQHLFKSKDKSLFFLWIGGNDYLPGSKDVDGLTTHVVSETIKDLDKIVNAGGKNFIILNLPDLGRTPAAMEKGIVANLHELSVKHNAKLNTAIAQYQAKHPNIHITTYNIYDLFNDLLDHPDKYNKAYQVNLTNLTNACWQGGYTLQNASTPDAMVQYQLQQANNSLDKPVDKDTLKAVAAQTSHSLALQEALQTQSLYQAGARPCAHAEQYVFWDHIHPTATTHTLLAKVIEASVRNNFTVTKPQ